MLTRAQPAEPAQELSALPTMMNAEALTGHFTNGANIIAYPENRRFTFSSRITDTLNGYSVFEYDVTLKPGVFVFNTTLLERAREFTCDSERLFSVLVFQSAAELSSFQARTVNMSLFVTDIFIPCGVEDEPVYRFVASVDIAKNSLGTGVNLTIIFRAAATSVDCFEQAKVSIEHHPSSSSQFDFLQAPAGDGHRRRRSSLYGSSLDNECACTSPCDLQNFAKVARCTVENTCQTSSKKICLSGSCFAQCHKNSPDQGLDNEGIIGAHRKRRTDNTILTEDSCSSYYVSNPNANNNKCEEKRFGFTGYYTCAAGTDYTDCRYEQTVFNQNSCSTANNGICEEYDFSGYDECQAGTDTSDCNEVEKNRVANFYAEGGCLCVSKLMPFSTTKMWCVVHYYCSLTLPDNCDLCKGSDCPLGFLWAYVVDKNIGSVMLPFDKINTFDLIPDQTFSGTLESGAEYSCKGSVKCENCGLQGSIGLTFALDVSLEGKINSAKFIITGQVVQQVTLISTFEGTIEKEWNGPLAKDFVEGLNNQIALSLGPIAFLIKPTFKLEYSYHILVKGEIKDVVNQALKMSNIKLGYSYDQSVVTTYNYVETMLGPYTESLVAWAAVTITAAPLKLTLGIQLFSMLSSDFTLKPYLKAAITGKGELNIGYSAAQGWFTGVNGIICLEFSYGLSGSVGAILKPFGLIGSNYFTQEVVPERSFDIIPETPFTGLYCAQSCVGAFGSFSVCSKSCGGGNQTQTFNITTVAFNGGYACSATNGQINMQACNTQACPVNCTGAFGSFSVCSKSCGGGNQTQTFAITTVASNGGSACSATNGQVNIQACNTQACNVITPINCVGSYSSFNVCSKSCGGGNQTQTFAITTDAANGGSACSATNGQVNIQACNTQACGQSYIRRTVTIDSLEWNEAKFVSSVDAFLKKQSIGLFLVFVDSVSDAVGRRAANKLVHFSVLVEDLHSVEFTAALNSTNFQTALLVAFASVSTTVGSVTTPFTSPSSSETSATFPTSTIGAVVVGGVVLVTLVFVVLRQRHLRIKTGTQLPNERHDHSDKIERSAVSSATPSLFIFFFFFLSLRDVY